ncbi:MAG TPA: metallophosphoesterase, partial [Actinomycetota bacterium]
MTNGRRTTAYTPKDPSAPHPEGVPDVLVLDLAPGARLLVAGDLHLGTSRTAASSWATGELTRTIETWPGPGALVLAGDIFDLLTPGAEQDLPAILETHAAFFATLRRFAAQPDREIVCLPGNHDGRLAWDEPSAGAVRQALRCRFALAAEARMATGSGVRTILIEHGHQLDPVCAFADPRDPNDTPLGYHITRELLPTFGVGPDSWLADGECLENPHSFPNFVASRLVYRRILGHPGWIVAVLAAGALLRLPMIYRLLAHVGRPLGSAGLTAWTMRLVLALLGELLLVGGVVLLGARRVWQSAGRRLQGRGSALNDTPRRRAEDLAARGYAGLITGHTHQPELTLLGASFYANVGSGTKMVSERRARLCLPPVYLPELQLSWLEAEAAGPGKGQLGVRLVHARRAPRAGTWLERRAARRLAPASTRPAVAAELTVPAPSGAGTVTNGRDHLALVAERGLKMRVLIISAKVGEGHDAAARGIAEEILDGYPDADVRIVNGLKAASRLAERMVVDGYKFQLRRAPWSYEALYTSIVRSRRFATFLYNLSGVVGGRRIQRLIEEADPDVVLSTYPLTSAMLAWLKERGRLTVPCTGILTDFAPHPLWLYEPLDANFVMHPGTIPATDDVPGMIGRPRMEVVAPPVSRRFYGPSRRDEARATLGIPADAFVSLVVGGGWGVGELSSTAWAASGVPDAWTVVVCGRNEVLRKALTNDPPPRSVILGFVDNMPELMDAADVMIHNAGGCTSLEAFVRGCPVLVTGPIPGHGVTCAELMEKVGAAAYVRDPADLPVVLRACAGDAGLRPRAAALATELGLYPATASRLASLVGSSRTPRTGGGGSVRPEAAGPAHQRPASGAQSRKRRLVAAAVALLTGIGVMATGTPVSMA